MQAVERSKAASITTGNTMMQWKVAGGDPNTKTGDGVATGDPRRATLTRGACRCTRWARFTARYHGLLKGHPPGVSLRYRLAVTVLRRAGY